MLNPGHCQKSILSTEVGKFFQVDQSEDLIFPGMICESEASKPGLCFKGLCTKL